MSPAALLDIGGIEEAALALKGRILRTPCLPSPTLSTLAGCELWLKLENLQHAGSFKARGAFIRLNALTPAERKRGVVAMSAGNHAQGVDWHARALGIPATIVMPRDTPFTKVERTRGLGAQVVLEGAGLSESQTHAEALAERDGLVLVHPYDDPRIIAGQGTVALEMLADMPDLDSLVVPIGGGGLCAGMAIAAKALRPDLQIYGVQSELYPFMTGQAPAQSGQTIAEGIAVKRPGRLTRPVIEALCDDILLVGEAAIERAVALLLDQMRLVAEGAGAAPLAAILARPELFGGRKVGMVLSGGNIDPRLLSSILMRSLARAGRMARLRIEVSDAPGSLSQVARLIGDGGGNIIEIQHQRLFHDVPVKYAELDVVLETTSRAHLDAILAALHQAGFPARLLGISADGGD